MIYGQFKRLNELIQIKKRIMNNYKKNLMGLNIQLKGLTNLILEFDKKYKIQPDILIEYLNKNKIQANRLPAPFNIKKNYNKKNFVYLKRFYQNSIVLPSNFNLSNQDIQLISKKIKYFFNSKFK